MARDEAAQARVELQALQRAAEDVINARDLDDVLARCIDYSREVANTTSGVIYLRDPQRGIFRRLVARDTLSDQVHLPIEQVDAALATRNYFIADLDEPQHQWQSAVQAARERGFRLSLNVGMRWRGRLIGLLGLAWREHVVIPPSTLQTLEALAGYQAAAIENARTLMLLEARARMAQTLREFSARALTTVDGAALERQILDAAIALTRGDGGVMARAEGDRYRLAVGHHANGPEFLPASDPLIDRAISAGKPLLIDDLARAPADSQITAAAHVGGYRSLALLALHHGGTATGLLIVGLTRQHSWNVEEVEALETLAQVSSEALERCRVKQLEAHERRRIDATLEHLPIGVVVVDGSGRVVHKNRASIALGTLLGTMSKSYGEGVAMMKRSDGDAPPQLGSTLIGLALKGELPPPRDVEVFDGNGRRRVIRGVAAPLHGPGEPPEAVMGFSDVTELFDLAAEKNRFLRIASHELRSPVTALRATTQLLTLDPSIDGDPLRRRTLYDRLDRVVQRLVRLVASLLDSTQLSADALPLEFEDVDLVALGRQVIEESGPRIRLVAAGEVRCRCDRSRIEQVVSNLTSNALQYSPPESPVDLELSHAGGRVRVAVHDQGSGIPADQLDRVFTPFFRGAHAGEQHKSGMGLGLHITRQIVQRHGGSIRVQSQEGSGSSFIVELPAGAPADGSAR